MNLKDRFRANLIGFGTIRFYFSTKTVIYSIFLKKLIVEARNYFPKGAFHFFKSLFFDS